MKKITLIIVCLLTAYIMMSPLVYAQEKQEQKQEKQVSEKFLTMWKKVRDKTKDIRAYKTEKAVTVAGVRGVEATIEVLKHLYFKGGVPYPSRLELKNAIEMLETFIKENPKDSTLAESKFFIAQCEFQMGDVKKATTVYEDIIKNHPKLEYALLAKEELDKIKKNK